MKHAHRFRRVRPGATGLALALVAVLAATLAVGGPRAAAQETPKSEPEAAKMGQSTAQRLVFSLYYYGFQADPRKPVPFSRVRTEKGQTLLTNHPWESIGPWISYDRAQWHQDNLEELAEMGADVILPVYRGNAEDRRGYALKGLDVLVQALKELRGGKTPFARPRDYPQIGMALDLSSLAQQYGGPVDLKDADVQRSLYGMIRDFFTHVPAEFRATVQLPAERLSAGDAVAAGSAPRGAGYVIRLLDDSAVKDVDAGFVDAVNRRFAQEFGARIVWVGTPALQKKLNRFEAVAPYPAASQPASLDAGTWTRSGSIGPGFDSTSQGAGATIRARENGQQTIVEFRRLLEANPDWIFLDSWNGYQHGSEIAPTLEYGPLYRDLFRAAIYQYKQPNNGDFGAVFLKTSAPRFVEPGPIYQVEVVVQNTGTTDWDAFNLTSLSFRWLKDGKPVGGPVAEISNTGQARGESRTFLIGLASPRNEGELLPPGQYELEFNMTRRAGGERRWFDATEATPLRIPVTVGAPPAPTATWMRSSMTTLARRGATYPAQVRLRNESGGVWKAGTTSVGYRWRKVSTYLKGVSQDSDAVVAEGKRVPLPVDALPGQIFSVDVPVAITDASGQPLPTSSPKDDWYYVLEWDVHDGQGWLSAKSGATHREPVQVVDRDTGASFIGCSLSPELVAGRTEKVTVGIRNLGPEEWKQGRDKVAVHWFYMDGTEASWNDDSLPLPEDVPPFSRLEVQIPNKGGLAPDAGDRDRKKKKDEAKFRTEVLVKDAVLRDVPVRVPYYFGPMYCVLDFIHDGINGSTGPASKGRDMLVIPVNVYSPTFTPVPLLPYFNVDGMSPDVDRTDGNLDGRGNSFPAEPLPPYIARSADGPAPVPLFPSGLWSRPLNDFEASRVCFMYPNKVNGQPNMVRCAGQRILFAGMSRTAVHLLVAATAEDVSGEFILYYADGTSEKKRLTFTHWNDPPKHGERVGFATMHRHTARGDDPTTRCYLHHHTIDTDRLKQLVGVELPKVPAVNVMGLTLEAAAIKIGQ